MEKTIPKLLRAIAEKHPNVEAELSKDKNGVFRSSTFSQILDESRRFASGLQNLGVKRNDRVGLISENRREWLISDLAILSLGAIDVPRGNDSSAKEIAYILSFSECALAIVEDAAQLQKLVDRKSELPNLKSVIILREGDVSDTTEFKLHRFRNVLDSGRSPEHIDKEIEKGESDDAATIIFTSGTTGTPKGVMLTHRNFLFQVQYVPDLISVKPGDRWLSVLPVWHTFERIMQYVAMASISTLCYSKPVGSILLEDMQKVRPAWMASVPRIWATVHDGIYKNVNKGSALKKCLFLFFVAVSRVWRSSADLVLGLVPRFKLRNRFVDFLIGMIPLILLWPLKALGSVLVFRKIKQKLGGRFVAGISGGGSLPTHVDKFFRVIGVQLLEGYGLTESAPVLSLRPQWRQVPGTIGPAFPETELKIVGEAGTVLGPNQTGVLYARGPQVMKGYYKQEALTRQVIDSDNFLNTGDLAKCTHDGEYAIVGRAKDTIVLLGGENVEPAPIEQKLTVSPYIYGAVVVGQDKKFLGALIQVDVENVKNWATEKRVPYTDELDLLKSSELKELISEEISSLISPRNYFRLCESVARFIILTEPFEVGRELSMKQEIKRHSIAELHAGTIEAMFK